MRHETRSGGGCHRYRYTYVVDHRSWPSPLHACMQWACRYAAHVTPLCMSWHFSRQRTAGMEPVVAHVTRARPSRRGSMLGGTVSGDGLSGQRGHAMVPWCTAAACGCCHWALRRTHLRPARGVGHCPQCTIRHRPRHSPQAHTSRLQHTTHHTPQRAARHVTSHDSGAAHTATRAQLHGHVAAIICIHMHACHDGDGRAGPQAA